MLDAYPLDVGVDEANQINKNVEMVLEHRNYIYKLPVYIRLIDFTNPKQLQQITIPVAYSKGPFKTESNSLQR